MEKKLINPQGLSKPTGYTHVITVEGAKKLIFISGQVGFDNRGQLVGPGDLSAQARQAFDNLAVALEAAGAKPDDVTKMNIYVVNLKESDRTAIGEARNRTFSKERPPASTLIGVTALALAGLMIEVEAIAAIG